MNLEIFPLDTRSNEQLAAISALHAELLPDSPIPRLGPSFVEGFYYRKLVESGLIHVELARFGGRYVAFSVWTKYPFTFMKEGIRRHWLSLCAALLLSLLQNPSRFTIMLDVYRQSKARALTPRPGAGEYLSLGVLTEAAALRSAEGLRLPQAMFERVIAFFKAEKFEEILLMIRKTNSKSLFFYRSYGAEKVETDFVASDCVLMAVHP